MAHAATGGQVGVNGSFYLGGQFLPNSEMTVKGAKQVQKRTAPRKVEVEPYKWVESREGMLPLYRRFGSYVTLRNTTSAGWMNYNSGAICTQYLAAMGCDIESCIEEAKTWIDAWAAGMRWENTVTGETE